MTTFEQPPEQIYGPDAGVPSLHTKSSYRNAFRRFLRYLDKEDRPQELLQQDPKTIEQQIIGYIHFLCETKKYVRDSLKTPMGAIFNFYELNDIVLNKRKITRFLPADDSSANADRAAANEDRAYTHEEIAQMLQVCDDRSRMMILLMASTGMRIGALDGLQVGHISKIPEYNLYKILVYAASRKERYYTFCTPECATAIDSYLDYRRRFGDPLKPTAPLIREQFDIRVPALSPKTLKYETIQWIVNEILKRSGLKTKEVARSHGFRKFAITQMKKAKVDFNDREYLVGHRHSRGLDVNYDRTSEEDRLQEYLKAVDLLTINSENRLKIKIHQLELQRSEEFTILMEKIQYLERKEGRSS